METKAARLGRIRLRSMRRGMREMDLILGAFADSTLETMSEDDLTAYESLLAEEDHDLYRWILGLDPVPAAHTGLIARIAKAAEGFSAGAARGA